MLYQTHPPLFIPIPSLSPFTCSILSSTSTSPLSLLLFCSPPPNSPLPNRLELKWNAWKRL
ncbi:hypothetical protein ACFX11_027328 [Malus domestica]